MAFGNQMAEQRFPFPAALVYDHLLKALSENNFKITNADKLIRRVNASASMSLLSWGENIAISIDEAGDDASVVRIDSSLKNAMSWTGTHRNQKNIDTIIMALSRSLQGRAPVTPGGGVPPRR